MIDGHIHIERGTYTLDWINQFVSKAVEMEMMKYVCLSIVIDLRSLFQCMILCVHKHPNPT